MIKWFLYYIIKALTTKTRLGQEYSPLIEFAPPLGIIDVKGKETQPLRQSFQKLSSYIHTADESPDQIRTQIHTGTVGVRIR